MIEINISSSFDLNTRRVEINSWLLNVWGFVSPFSLLKKIKSLLNLQFDNLFVIAKGALEVVGSYSSEKALSELSSLKKFLPKLRKMVSLLETRHFFKDEALKEKVTLTLDSLYELEGELRIKAFSGKPKQKTSPDFINALSGKSKKALISTLEKDL